MARRVVRLLAEVAHHFLREQGASTGISRQEIAEMVGASREMVSRVVKNLELLGPVEVRNGRRIKTTWRAISEVRLDPRDAARGSRRRLRVECKLHEVIGRK